MARSLRKPNELRKAAEEADEAAAKLREVADKIEAEGMDGLLVHGDSIINNHLPRVWDWANSLLTEFESQARAFRFGKESKASYDQRRNKVNPELHPKPPVKKPKKKRS